MTLGCTLCAPYVFASKFTKFPVIAFNGSLSIVCSDFDSCDCSFISSLGHQNVADFHTRLAAHLDLVFITYVEICVTRKAYDKLGKNALLHRTKKVKYRNFSGENMQNLETMFCTTNWGLFTNDSLGNTTDIITYYMKFCSDVCCPTETIFVSFDRLTSPQLKRL